MTNPIAVSQQRRRILARQICAWAQSTNLSAKDAEDFACAAIDAFEAEIRADERDTCIETVGSCQLECVLTPGFADGLSSAVAQIQAALRNQKDHDHE